MHRDVWNAGFEEFWSHGLEAEMPVETRCMDLCVQACPRMSLLARLFHQGLQQQRSHAAGAVGLQNGHAADVTVGQQASGSYKPALASMGKRVNAMRVVLVHFQFRRHALLAYEYLLAYAARLKTGLFPIADAD